MRPIAVAGGVLITAALTGLLFGLYLSSAVISDGGYATCWKQGTVPLGVAIRDDGEFNIDAHAWIPFGVSCTFHLQDGSARTQYIDIATVPSLTSIGLGVAESVALIAGIRYPRERSENAKKDQVRGGILTASIVLDVESTPGADDERYGSWYSTSGCYFSIGGSISSSSTLGSTPYHELSPGFLFYDFWIGDQEESVWAPANGTEVTVAYFDPIEENYVPFFVEEANRPDTTLVSEHVEFEDYNDSAPLFRVEARSSMWTEMDYFGPEDEAASARPRNSLSANGSLTT